MDRFSKYTDIKAWIVGIACAFLDSILPIGKFLGIVVVFVILDFVTGNLGCGKKVRKDQISNHAAHYPKGYGVLNCSPFGALCGCRI
jgi:hypothetical protein